MSTWTFSRSRNWSRSGGREKVGGGGKFDAVALWEPDISLFKDARHGASFELASRDMPGLGF